MDEEEALARVRAALVAFDFRIWEFEMTAWSFGQMIAGDADAVEE